jgi:hypothetical protein
MLSPETPFPYVGSYALFEDPDAPPPQPTELVRILWRREGFAMVSFPLRDGAGGNKTVAADALTDATPLTDGEQREFHDLDRDLAGRSLRTVKQRRQVARRDALKRRAIYAPLLARLLRQARRQAETRRAA